ncbi:DinB family protein [Bacillus sp. CLL-7-23]|uniref:DinB family protein n=1 Tax=Bacillus changyiensis TaxID=3004103 RepID=A0ABT4X1H2_9BACI|nr:DinB family protein [Bacillus changyiensis]MDA7026143.1 DinB family protein [Bacillus changyiensis]
MNEVHTLRNVLLNEMEKGVESTCRLLEKVKETDWPYRPAERMRNLKELTSHLIAIPETDLAIMQENKEEMIMEIEKKYSLMPANQMRQAMQKGFEHFTAYMTSLSDEEFLTKKTTPFYLDKGLTQSQWLTETLTHLFHHRAQLFNYLKQLDYEVSMFDLYI